MAMVASGGVDVVVANDESTSAGSGMKIRLYNADKATLVLPTLPVLGSTTAPYRPERPAAQSDIDTTKTARLAILRDAARRANAYGNAIVIEIQATATAHVSTGLGGLQNLPNPPNAGSATVAPGAPADIPIT